MVVLVESIETNVYLQIKCDKQNENLCQNKKIKIRAEPKTKYGIEMNSKQKKNTEKSLSSYLNIIIWIEGWIWGWKVTILTLNCIFSNVNHVNTLPISINYMQKKNKKSIELDSYTNNTENHWKSGVKSYR